MKRNPDSELQCLTPSERLDRAFRTVLMVPKDRLLKEEAKEKRRRQRKREKKTTDG